MLKESTGTAQVTVTRTNGADGKVSVQWKSEDMTAIEGRDYKGREGTITFEHGEIKKFIEIPIIDDHVSWALMIDCSFFLFNLRKII